METSPTRAPFPTTHWSLLQKPGEVEERRRRLEELARLYWKPIYAHVRLKWGRSREEAEDLTQEFFAWILEGSFLERAEPGHGRFRGFVRAHVDHFMLNHLRAGRRLKRGGGLRVVSLDAGESLLAALKDVPPEEILDREWRRSVLEEALRRLRNSLEAEGRRIVFDALERYDLVPEEKRPTYAVLAAELKVQPSDIDNYLSSARKRLYDLLREVVGESVDGSEALRAELDDFFPRR